MSVSETRKNNLFTFATSELSHDAFVAWLLSYAKPEHEQEAPALASCARRLLAHMMEKAGLELQTDEPERLQARVVARQYHEIDIYVTVERASGETLHVIIEDKIYTKEHSNQLQRYREKIAKLNGVDVETLPAIVVYYKIIEEKERVGPGIAHVDRKQLLTVLEPFVAQTGGHAIFSDYVAYLRQLDESAQQFAHRPISEWDYHAYLGFFAWLCNPGGPQIDTSHYYGWDYVPNPTGGFLGMYWYFINGEKLRASGLAPYVGQIFLQIEKDKIVVKLEGGPSTSDKSRISDIRWKLYHYFCGLDARFQKRAFKPGKTMTIGYMTYNEQDSLEKIRVMEAAMQSILDGMFQYQ